MVPPNRRPASIAPSLAKAKRGIGTVGGAVEQINGDPIDDFHVGERSRVAGVAVPVNGYSHHPATTAPKQSKGAPYPYDTEAEPGNPTVVPRYLLAQFHFTFLIRDPHYSIPSYYRCTIPPLDAVTGFYHFNPSEAGYDEVRRVFEYLRKNGLVGPKLATDGIHEDDAVRFSSINTANGFVVNGSITPVHTNGIATNGNVPHDGKAEEHEEKCTGEVEICVIDADDLLDNPDGMMRAYCKSIGVEYTPDMLQWDTKEDHAVAEAAFEKWRGFHEDAIDSKGLTARTKVSLPFALPFPPLLFLFHSRPSASSLHRGS